MGSENWEHKQLSSVISKVVDNRGKTPVNSFYGEHELIEVNAISDTYKYPQYKDVRKFVDSKTYNTWFRAGHPIIGDVLVPTVGSLGAVSYVNENRGCIAQNLIALRANTEICTGQFLYYSLRNPVLRRGLLNLDIGGVQPSIKVPHLLELTFSLPRVTEQNEITATLSCLDDKIELKNRIIANLEAQAQAIFKSWFVDFEPFLDGEFEETELGLIPKGWRVGVLSDIAKITMGQSPSGESFNENEIGTVFYQGRAEFGFRFPTRRLHTTAPTRMAQSGDVLLSVRAPVGDINVATEECCIGRGLSAVHSINGCQSYLIYLVKQLRDVLDQFNGEGTVFGSINRKDLNQLAAIIPPLENMQQFEEVVGRFDAEILTLYKENTLLITTRDTLLPKLMSGEIEVPVEG